RPPHEPVGHETISPPVSDFSDYAKRACNSVRRIPAYCAAGWDSLRDGCHYGPIAINERRSRLWRSASSPLDSHLHGSSTMMVTIRSLLMVLAATAGVFFQVQFAIAQTVSDAVPTAGLTGYYELSAAAGSSSHASDSAANMADESL